MFYLKVWLFLLLLVCTRGHNQLRSGRVEVMVVMVVVMMVVTHFRAHQPTAAR